jgi:hypothetical protein
MDALTLRRLRQLWLEFNPQNCGAIRLAQNPLREAKAGAPAGEKSAHEH